MREVLLSQSIEPVEYCSGLCISPDAIKIDALRLMAYSNSKSPLKERASYCSVTNHLDGYVFSEILNLFVSLSLRTRLWKTNYSRGEETAEIDNAYVGMCRQDKANKIGKPVKISEVLSYVSHAEAFWFDPCIMDDFPTGANISIEVPPDRNRSSNYLQAISTVKDSLSAVETISETEKDQFDSVIKKLVDANDSTSEISRIYTINLDQFSCAVGAIIDVCHKCAGITSTVSLDSESGLPTI